MSSQMHRSVFKIPKMDCPSEERMVRMALEQNGNIKKLEFDFKERILAVIHSDKFENILSALEPLNYGAKLQEDGPHKPDIEELEENLDPVKEANVLKILLAINGTMFIVEMIFGLMAQSMGLISDSLDMLADAAVYGLSLYAVGKALSMKKKAARMSGYLQVALVIIALTEVIRRFIFGSEPEGLMMIGVSAIALIANISCLFVLFKHKGGGVHMKASWIFSTNDVIANMGVIAAGVFVYYTKSPYPDLVIGLIVAIIVMRGAISILKISSDSQKG